MIVRADTTLESRIVRNRIGNAPEPSPASDDRGAVRDHAITSARHRLGWRITRRIGGIELGGQRSATLAALA
jgi:hypothetical protein